MLFWAEERGNYFIIHGRMETLMISLNSICAQQRTPQRSLIFGTPYLGPRAQRPSQQCSCGSTSIQHLQTLFRLLDFEKADDSNFLAPDEGVDGCLLCQSRFHKDIKATTACLLPH